MRRNVQKRDGTTQEVPLDPNVVLVANPGLDYLRKHPAATGRECTNAKEHDAATCNYLHFVTSSSPLRPQPTPPAVAQRQPVAQISPPPPAAQVTRRVMFPDEAIKDIPETDIVPNAALTYFQQNPTAYRRLCTNRSAGHAIDACNFVHLRNAVPQPAPPPAPPAAQVTRRVMFPDETIKDIPETDIVPNAALTYLQQNPTAYRKLCTNHSAGHAIDACNFIHMVQQGPPAAQLPAGPASLFIGVVVDGFCFTKRFGWDTEAFTQLINEITRWISQAANKAALVHKDAKVFLYPNSTDARRKQLISDAQLSSTMSALDRLRDAGWRVIHTNFKLVGELWKATAEDVAFSNECASLCCTGALAPLGASPARITLHHVVIVTGDNDHVSTFGTQSNNELRWLVDMNPSPDPNQPLRRAAREAQRLIPCTAVPECDRRFMPSVTADIEALREQLAQEAVGPPLVDRV